MNNVSNKLPESFEWIKRIKKFENNPIIRPQGEYASDLIFNPAATVKDDKVWMLCRCMNLADKRRNGNWGISSFVWAKSDDGINFKLDEKPFLYPQKDSEYNGGFEDPRLVYIEEEKVWALTYTGVKCDAKNNIYTPGMLAISKDLINWEFLGECFPYRAICITDRKINGKYWAYYGNSGIYIAWSEDLRKWNTDEREVISPRKNYFDEILCEGAAAPIITDEGILLLYNGASSEKSKIEYASSIVDYKKEFPYYCYTTGWALFDRNDPSKVIARSDKPFLIPEESFELFGLCDYTVFTSGYVLFKGKHHLYYGCCDTRIGVALAKEQV